MKSELGIFIMLPFLLAGCATESQKMARPSKQTPTCVSFKTDNVLYSEGLGQAGIERVTRRIQEYLTKNLKRRGITVETNDCKPSDAKLTVELKTIEAMTVSEFGFWSAIASQHPKFKWEATFTSGEGVNFFTCEDRADDPSLDRLCEIVSDRVGGRIAGWYK